MSESLARRLGPVHWIPADPQEDAPQEGVALCLSGGGYRAMLFHLGALWRLNELRYLPRLRRVSSVSGGSITAAALAMAWNELGWQDDRATEFEGRLVEPLRRLAGKTIDWPSVLLGFLLPGMRVANVVAFNYRWILFKGRTLQAMPPEPAPLFVINATSMQTGTLWRFSRGYAANYQIGTIDRPEIRLADAVAASSAFPPFLSPMVMRVDPGEFAADAWTDPKLRKPPFNTRLVLTDGGVYDNLGLETAWKKYRTVLVSDGGGELKDKGRPWPFWPLQTVRTLALIDSQVRALRKRKLISSYETKLANGTSLREGTYWGIRSDVEDYELDDALLTPEDEQVRKLAETKTRLGRLRASRQEQLINWGYLICDTAMRKHVVSGVTPPGELPYPDSELS